MMSDLLEVSDAKILLVSHEETNNIARLLKENNYQTERVTSFVMAGASIQKNTPDLIIFNASDDFQITEFIKYLATAPEQHNSPSIFLINTSQETIPETDSMVKDFINTPINEAEFSYRLHHLVKSLLECKELHAYNQTILETVQQRNEELRASQEEIIECLGYAAEFRDSETGMHTLRVGRYAHCIAKAMGMNDKEAEVLLYAAPMHDVGKIGISDAILLKPGRLDEQEMEVMKQHTVIGEKILSRSKNNLLQQASLIALHHHEKWDGSGYPQGLKGSDIHLYGRIVAVVDVFDALTMERPYKKAWTTDAAVALINAGVKQHFDPEIVQLFNDNLADILAIKSAYVDDQDSCSLLEEYIAQ